MSQQFSIPYKPFEKQRLFHYSQKKFRALIGGIGSGKTKAGVQEVFRVCAMHPGVNGIVVAPTYRMLHDVTRLEFLSVCEKTPGLLVDFNKGEDTAVLVSDNTVFFRSADDPEKLRGPNVGWFYADESAMMAEMAWNVLIGRLRLEPALGWTTTTPKGKNWLYRVFGEPDDEHDMIRVRSADNPYLPETFIRSLNNSYTSQFAAQELLGEFVDIEGALARREWFEIVGVAPVGCHWVRAWDFAATEKGIGGDDPDFTVGVKLGESDDRFYIGHVIRERCGPGDVEALVRQTAHADGVSVPIVLEQEPGSSGKLFSQAMVRQLAGWDITAHLASGDKVTRAMPWLAQAQVGNVKIVRGDWVPDLLDEIAAFPVGGHDDQVDAISGAFAALLSLVTGPVEMTANPFYGD